MNPELGSWRGDNTITVTGVGYDNNTQVWLGGVEASVTSLEEDRLTFTAPALSASPANNLPVGLVVANGDLEAFQAGVYTYVADPIVEAIGEYRSSSGQVVQTDKRFLFNAGESIGVRGRGLGPMTQIRINGVLVKVQQPAADTLVVPVPSDAIGTLSLEISNDGFNQDVVLNDELVVRFDGREKLRNVDLVARDGALLATTYGQDLRLYSVADLSLIHI